MGFLSGIGDLLKQYLGGGATPGPAVEQHFDQVAPAVPSSTLAGDLGRSISLRASCTISANGRAAIHQQE